MAKVNARTAKAAGKSKSALAAKKALAKPGRCWVSATYAGAPIRTVKENRCYWLNHSGGKSTGSLVFVVTFDRNSVLRTQTQTFHFPRGYGGATTTPFGVPNWGGNSIHGAAQLTVITDHDCCTYDFKVTG